jgi:hypothetical protein
MRPQYTPEELDRIVEEIFEREHAKSRPNHRTPEEEEELRTQLRKVASSPPPSPDELSWELP